MKLTRLLLAFPALAFATPAAAQTTLVKTGDVIPNVGIVTRIDDVDVNSSGQWIVEVDTDNASSSADAAIIENGVLKFHEGSNIGLTALPGATLRFGDRMAINDAGETMYLLSVTLSTGTTSYIVLWNDILVFQTDVTPFNAPGAPAGAVWSSVNETWFNSNNQMLVGGRLSSGEDLLAKVTFDAAGTMISEEIVAIDGTTIAGHNAEIQGFSLSRRRQAINASGDILWFVDDAQQTPGGQSNTCCDSWVYMNNAPILHEGEPSPTLPANLIGTLSSVEVGLNDGGEWIAQMAQNPSTYNMDILLKNGTDVIAAEGFSLPSIPSGFLITSLGSTTGVFLSNSSDVMWYGKWDDPDTAIDSGIFFNQQLFLQEGVSLVNGVRVTGMPAGDNTMDVSNSGDFLIVELQLENGESGAYLFDVAGRIGDQYCGPAVANSTGVGSVLEAAGSLVPADNDVMLQASDLPSNSFGFFLVSNSQALTMNPGGSQGHLCLGGMIGRYVGPGQIQNSGSNGEFELAIDLTQIPQPTGFVSVQTGETWNFQAWHRDAVGGSATSNFTNGLEISFL